MAVQRLLSVGAPADGEVPGRAADRGRGGGQEPVPCHVI